MSDINTVKAQIQSLIDLANTTTGNTDTNLTDGVNALVSGYGQGGSGGNVNFETSALAILPEYDSETVTTIIDCNKIVFDDSATIILTE